MTRVLPFYTKACYFIWTNCLTVLIVNQELIHHSKTQVVDVLEGDTTNARIVKEVRIVKEIIIVKELIIVTEVKIIKKIENSQNSLKSDLKR